MCLLMGRESQWQMCRWVREQRFLSSREKEPISLRQGRAEETTCNLLGSKEHWEALPHVGPKGRAPLARSVKGGGTE